MSIYKNLKILDLTRMLSGPSCTQFFSDSGATVYKIEKPKDGDDTRYQPPFHNGDSMSFMSYNRGKKSVAIDITKPQGNELVRQLAAECDVFVENFKTGNLKKYGLDYDSIKKIKPDIVYCSITGYGQTGPKSHLPAYDFVIQGVSGLMDITGSQQSGPMRFGLVIVDHVTGLHAAIGISAALNHKANTGEGQHIDISMLDSALAVYGHTALGYVLVDDQPTRTGNTNSFIAPSDLFYCSDYPITLMLASQSQFRKLCEALNRTDLIDNPQYLTNSARVKNNHSLYIELSAEFKKHRRDDIISRFEVLGLPCGPVNNIQQVMNDPQVIHRQAVVRNGNLKSIASPLRFSQTPVEYKPSPKLGQHTEEVLKALGADIELLKSQNII